MKIYIFILTVCLFSNVFPGSSILALDISARDKIYSGANESFEKELFVKAEEEYKKVIEIDPDYAPAYNQLGLIYFLSEVRIRDSIINFIKAVKIDPFYADPFANLGIVCHKLGQSDKARLYLKRAVRLDPDEPEYQFSLGWIYLTDFSDNEKAIDHLKRATELRERFAAAHYILGLAYIDYGQRLMVLEQVTSLRLMNSEALASALEDIIRKPRPAEDESLVLDAGSQGVKIDYGISGYGRGALGGGASSVKGRISGHGFIKLNLKVLSKGGQKVKTEGKAKGKGKSKGKVRK